MKCPVCSTKIKTMPDDEGTVYCPKCHSEIPQRFAENFELYKEMGEKINPFDEIEIAPQVLAEQYEDIANHFIPQIIGVKGFLITDESSLLDFNFEIEDGKVKRDTDKTLKKIEDIYGVDVSDIKDLNLIKIFERLRILSPVFNQ